jgi:hypothetical protein
MTSRRIATLVFAALGLGLLVSGLHPFPCFSAAAAESASLGSVVEKSQYVFGWNGLPAAVADYTLSRRLRDGRPVLDFQGKARTTEVVDHLWRMRDSVLAQTDARTLSPRSFQLLRRENKTRLDTLLVHNPEEKKFRVERFKRGRLRKGTLPSAGVYDPVSAMLLVRREGLAPGKTRVIKVTEGKRIYEVTLRSLKRERISIRGRDFPALKIALDYRALDGSVSSADDGIKSTYLWVSDDPDHHVLRLEADSLLGVFFGERVS